MLDNEQDILFRNREILVTCYYLEMGDTTYAMESVKNVWAERDDPSILLPLASLLLGLGGVCWAVITSEEMMWVSLLAGGAMIAFGFVSMASLRPNFTVYMGLASKETLSLIVTNDGREAEALLLSLQKSLALAANAGTEAKTIANHRRAVEPDFPGAITPSMPLSWGPT